MGSLIVEKWSFLVEYCRVRWKWVCLDEAIVFWERLGHWCLRKRSKLICSWSTAGTRSLVDEGGVLTDGNAPRRCDSSICGHRRGSKDRHVSAGRKVRRGTGLSVGQSLFQDRCLKMFNGLLFSDYPLPNATHSCAKLQCTRQSGKVHLIICVHGLEGTHEDMKLVNNWPSFYFSSNRSWLRYHRKCARGFIHTGTQKVICIPRQTWSQSGQNPL